jgi:hypothetical protein
MSAMTMASLNGKIYRTIHFPEGMDMNLISNIYGTIQNAVRKFVSWKMNHPDWASQSTDQGVFSRVIEHMIETNFKEQYNYKIKMNNWKLIAFGLAATKFAMQVFKLSEKDAFFKVLRLNRDLFNRLVEYTPDSKNENFFKTNCKEVWDFKEYLHNLECFGFRSLALDSGM